MPYKISRKKRKHSHKKRKYRKNKIYKGGSNEDVGFIITRCVKKVEHNQLYKESYAAIRKHHPDLKIVIIDDNSDKNILEEIPMVNVEIIQSEFPGAGEYLPYYYLLTRKLFKKAMILQDSTFVNTQIPYENVNDYMFFYEFVKDLNIDNTGVEKIFQNTKKPGELLDFLRNRNWKGCWGTLMVITYDFLKKLDDTVGIENWKNTINNRDMRIALEKAMAIACIYVSGEKSAYSLFGNKDDLEVMKIEPGGSYNIQMYLEDKTRIKDKIIKVWNSR
jgi:hypothetical protein